jgi:hypothetical protein
LPGAFHSTCDPQTGPDRRLLPVQQKAATAGDWIVCFHALGGAGVEAPLGSFAPSHARRIGRKLEETGTYLEVWSNLPKDDTSTFERTVVEAKEVGTERLRAFCLGRRYEVFATLADR